MVTVQTVKHTEHVRDLVRLFNVVFGKSMSPESWVWKHLANPLNECEPFVVVAMDNGAVVGARPPAVNLRYGDALPAVVPQTQWFIRYQRQEFRRMNQLQSSGSTQGHCAAFQLSQPHWAGYINKDGEKCLLRDLIFLTNPERVAKPSVRPIRCWCG